MSKLLVVDDESSIRLLYSHELADEGYDVTTAATAMEAVEKLQKDDFDLILLDIKLKNESGVGTKELYKLFPKGPAKKAALIAGLGKPHGCI